MMLVRRTWSGGTIECRIDSKWRKISEQMDD